LLFDPIELRGLKARNRIVVSPMCQYSAQDGVVTDWHLVHLGKFAQGGAGIVFVEATAVEKRGRITHGDTGIWDDAHIPGLRRIADFIKSQGALPAIQLAHAGRKSSMARPWYGNGPLTQADSDRGDRAWSTIAPGDQPVAEKWIVPRAFKKGDFDVVLAAFKEAVRRSVAAGFDILEVHAAHGYLLHTFLSPLSNVRDDQYGGSAENRMRFPVEIVRRVREAVGEDFIIIYRLSMLDLVPGGSTLDEVITLAKAVEAAGATIINTGIGWHEARIPTIATSVPRGAYTWVTKKLMGAVSIPLVTTNRINTPELAEELLARGHADMISMARPMLADPDFVAKAADGKPEAINTCIGCNQACLDHTFSLKITSCLVNPRACHETELVLSPTRLRKRVAVVGAGPAGLACAVSAAERGHEVTLYDAASEVGGQLNVARRVPGKQEFDETLRYFRHQLDAHAVDVRLNTWVAAEDLAGYDEVVVATGVTPRTPDIPGVDHPSVVGYLDVLRDKAPVGDRVAILGAGGIGFDVAEFLTDGGDKASEDPATYFRQWGVDMDYATPGGLAAPERPAPPRTVHLLQRKTTKVGAGLGKTTGWIHRAELKHRGVTMVPGVRYDRIDDAGLHVTVGEESTVLPVDTIVVCTGQEPRRGLYEELVAAGRSVHLIGGADVAAELDAKRAIKQGTEVAAGL
jgi:2,4-dienoyl-CoA reductase (NADPH2)